MRWCRVCVGVQAPGDPRSRPYHTWSRRRTWRVCPSRGRFGLRGGAGSKFSRLASLGEKLVSDLKVGLARQGAANITKFYQVQTQHESYFHSRPSKHISSQLTSQPAMYVLLSWAHASQPTRHTRPADRPTSLLKFYHLFEGGGKVPSLLLLYSSSIHLATFNQVRDQQ